MDSQTLSVLIGAASLVIGFLACWLIMRGRIADATAQGKARAKSELAQAEERARALDADRQRVAASYEELKAQAMQSREALALARKEQAQLAERAERVPALELQLLKLQEQEKASKQEFLRLSASDAGHAESLQVAAARLAEAKEENAALKHSLAEISEALNTRPAPLEAYVSELPVLEDKVIELQVLARTIEEEFLELQEVQRNFTAASSALQDVS